MKFQVKVRSRNPPKNVLRSSTKTTDWILLVRLKEIAFGTRLKEVGSVGTAKQLFTHEERKGRNASIYFVLPIKEALRHTVSTDG